MLLVQSGCLDLGPYLSITLCPEKEVHLQYQSKGEDLRYLDREGEVPQSRRD